MQPAWAHIGVSMGPPVPDKRRNQGACPDTYFDVFSIGTRRNMRQITLRVPEDVLDEIEAEAEADGVTRSERIRDILRTRSEHAEHEERIDELETTLERLKREKRMVLEQAEEHGELVEYVEQERQIQRKRFEASLSDRIRYFIWGYDGDGQK